MYVLVCVTGVSSSLGGLKGCDWWQGTLWRWRLTANADMIQSGLRCSLTSRYCLQRFAELPRDEPLVALLLMRVYTKVQAGSLKQRLHRLGGQRGASYSCFTFPPVQTKLLLWRLSEGLKAYFQAVPTENTTAHLYNEWPTRWCYGLSYLLTV